MAEYAEYLAVFSNTRYGRAGWVTWGRGAEAALDAMPRAHKSKRNIGLVGYEGFRTFNEAVAAAAEWENQEPFLAFGRMLRVAAQ